MKKNKTMIFLFILPTVLCLLFMYVYPVVRTVIMSFFKVESLTASTSTWSFYGLQNYFKILRNAGFISSIKNMVMIWLVGGIITMCLSMLMAVILTSGIRGAKFFKAAIYMPNIISAVALATMWIQYRHSNRSLADSRVHPGRGCALHIRHPPIPKLQYG